MVSRHNFFSSIIFHSDFKKNRRAFKKIKCSNLRKNKITDRSAIIRSVESCHFLVSFFFFFFIRGVRISRSVRRNTVVLKFIIQQQISFVMQKMRNESFNFLSNRVTFSLSLKRSFQRSFQNERFQIIVVAFLSRSIRNLSSLFFFLLRISTAFTWTVVVWNRFSGWAKQRRINVIVEEEQTVRLHEWCLRRDRDRKRETERERERERDRKRERERERSAIPSRLFPFA